MLSRLSTWTFPGGLPTPWSRKGWNNCLIDVALAYLFVYAICAAYSCMCSQVEKPENTQSLSHNADSRVHTGPLVTWTKQMGERARNRGRPLKNQRWHNKTKIHDGKFYDAVVNCTQQNTNSMLSENNYLSFYHCCVYACVCMLYGCVYA